METNQESFEQFLKRREAAAQAYVRGDAAPLDGLVARDSEATFFGPRGGSVRGAEEVASRYTKDAGAFESDSKTNFEILDSGSSGDLGYWVGIQRATVRFRGDGEAKPLDLRITEVFRREGGEWKMVHRHADTLTTEQEKGK